VRSWHCEGQAQNLMQIFFQLRLVENALCEIIHFDSNVISTTMQFLLRSFLVIELFPEISTWTLPRFAHKHAMFDVRQKEWDTGAVQNILQSKLTFEYGSCLNRNARWLPCERQIKPRDAVMCNHKLKHSWEELLYLPIQNLISIINPVTYLKNQSIRKKETEKTLKNKIKVIKSYKCPKKGRKRKKKCKMR